MGGHGAACTGLPFRTMHRAARSVHACIGIGSNLGDRTAHIESALKALARLPGTRLLASSSVIETEPAGPIPQGRYLNAAALLETDLGPRDLLRALLGIEAVQGRIRASEPRWGPRTLDLDLLLYGEEVVREPGLVIPHPRLHERLFVLGPLAEVAGDLNIPTLGRTVRESLSTLAAGMEHLEGNTL